MVTREDMMRRYPNCGVIEEEFENSKWFSVFMQLVFTLVGMYFFWLMLGEATLGAPRQHRRPAVLPVAHPQTARRRLLRHR